VDRETHKNVIWIVFFFQLKKVANRWWGGEIKYSTVVKGKGKKPERIKKKRAENTLNFKHSRQDLFLGVIISDLFFAHRFS